MNNTFNGVIISLTTWRYTRRKMINVDRWAKPCASASLELLYELHTRIGMQFVQQSCTSAFCFSRSDEELRPDHEIFDTAAGIVAKRGNRRDAHEFQIVSATLMHSAF